jgi:hypothetical protein
MRVRSPSASAMMMKSCWGQRAAKVNGAECRHAALCEEHFYSAGMSPGGLGGQGSGAGGLGGGAGGGFGFGSGGRGGFGGGVRGPAAAQAAIDPRIMEDIRAGESVHSRRWVERGTSLLGFD